MKLGKMLSVGEVVEHTTDEPTVATTDVATPIPVVEVTQVAEREPAAVTVHADR
jgi:hypothetical protein